MKTKLRVFSSDYDVETYIIDGLWPTYAKSSDIEAIINLLMPNGYQIKISGIAEVRFDIYGGKKIIKTLYFGGYNGDIAINGWNSRIVGRKPPYDTYNPIQESIIRAKRNSLKIKNLTKNNR